MPRRQTPSASHGAEESAIWARLLLLASCAFTATAIFLLATVAH